MKIYNNNCRHIDDWIEIVDSGKQKVGVNMKLAIEYVKYKLTLSNVYVDAIRINSCIELVEKNRPYKLAPVQRFLHALNVGVMCDDGDILFEKFILICGRGFGKNALLSDAMLFLTSNRNGIRNYHCELIANNELQSKISFMDVHEMIGNNEQLKKAYRRSLSEITFINTNSKIHYNTSNARTKDGKRPGLIAFDEPHEYDNYDGIKVFTSSLGKVPHGRIWYLSTDGYVRGSVMDDLKQESLEILQGLDRDSRVLPIYCQIDSYEEWEDPSCWVKANPMLPYLPELQKAYERDFKDAKRNASLKIEFLTKRLNWPLEDTATSVASWNDILATNQEIPELANELCIGAVDYADVRDFIAVGLLFKKGNKRYWISHTFIVQESLKLTKFKLDIDVAITKGLVTIIPGKIMNEDYIVNWFLMMSKKYRIKNIAMDRFRISVLRNAFMEAGLPFQEVPSGPITHGKLAPLVDTMFANHSIVYGNDMMMRWYTNNVYVEMDAKGNKTYKKIEPEKRKTDGFMAFIHALSLDEQLEVRKIVKYNKGLKTKIYYERR